MSDIYLADIKGSTSSLDPRSKVLTTVICVMSVAASIDYFQIFLYLLLFIPILILFKPRMEFLRRIVLPLILVSLFAMVFYFSIQTERVTIQVFYYTRRYSKLEFVVLIIYRYFVIVLFDYMLLYSEPSHTDIIEAFASFRLGTTVISILLLIKRVSTKVSMDYQKMVLAAESKGAFTSNIVNIKGLLRNIYIRLLILSRTFVRTASYSNTISKSLTARGFHNYFQPTIRPWSSEGITVTIISTVLCLCIIIIPWVR